MQVIPQLHADHDLRRIRYHKAPSAIVNGGPWPSWVTDDMKFELRKLSGDHYAILSKDIQKAENQAMYAFSYKVQYITLSDFYSGLKKEAFILQNKPF